jgi:aminopeptidase N
MASCSSTVGVLAVLAACHAGTYPGGTGGTPKAEKVGKGGIAAAALPYQILDGRSGREVDREAFWTRVSAARAVCVGEEHPNPHHHWWQLEVVRRVVAKQPQVALGMEMFQRPFQGVLDDYAAKRIDAAALRSRSGWQERWGYDYDLYGPTIDVVVAAKGTLLALNAPKELTKKVVRKGLDALTPDERAQVPELNLTDKAHRAWFDALMDDMGGSTAHTHKPPATDPKDPPAEAPSQGEAVVPPMPSADQIYMVQVIWDETMADTAAKWLTAHPAAHLIILAGNGHCHDTAIVNRMKRRGIADVISLRPVIDSGEGEVAELLAKPMNDYVIVLQMPEGVKHAEPAN